MIITFILPAGTPETVEAGAVNEHAEIILASGGVWSAHFILREIGNLSVSKLGEMA